MLAADGRRSRQVPGHVELESADQAPPGAVGVQLMLHDDGARGVPPGVWGWVDDDLAMTVRGGSRSYEIAGPVSRSGTAPRTCRPAAHGAWLAGTGRTRCRVDHSVAPADAEQPLASLRSSPRSESGAGEDQHRRRAGPPWSPARCCRCARRRRGRRPRRWSPVRPVADPCVDARAVLDVLDGEAGGLEVAACSPRRTPRTRTARRRPRGAGRAGRRRRAHLLVDGEATARRPARGAPRRTRPACRGCSCRRAPSRRRRRTRPRSGSDSPGWSRSVARSASPTSSVSVVAVSTKSGVRSTPVTSAPAIAAIREVPPMPQPTSSSRVPGPTSRRSSRCWVAGGPPACSWSTANRSAGPRRSGSSPCSARARARSSR